MQGTQCNARNVGHAMLGTQYKWCAKYAAVLYNIPMFEFSIQYAKLLVPKFFEFNNMLMENPGMYKSQHDIFSSLSPYFDHYITGQVKDKSHFVIKYVYSWNQIGADNKYRNLPRI